MRESCIVCERKIHRGMSSIKRNHGPRDITCSRECSKVYVRIKDYVKTSTKERKEKLK